MNGDFQVQLETLFQTIMLTFSTHIHMYTNTKHTPTQHYTHMHICMHIHRHKCIHIYEHSHMSMHTQAHTWTVKIQCHRVIENTPSQQIQILFTGSTRCLWDLLCLSLRTSSQNIITRNSNMLTFLCDWIKTTKMIDCRRKIKPLLFVWHYGKSGWCSVVNDAWIL